MDDPVDFPFFPSPFPFSPSRWMILRPRVYRRDAASFHFSLKTGVMACMREICATVANSRYDQNQVDKQTVVISNKNQGFTVNYLILWLTYKILIVMQFIIGSINPKSRCISISVLTTWLNYFICVAITVPCISSRVRRAGFTIIQTSIRVCAL